MKRSIITNLCSDTRAYNAERVLVQDGLSLSASEMNQMNSRGIPISASVIADELLSKGHKGSDPDVPLLRQRGYDFSDIYVSEKAARDKVSNSISNSETSE